MNHKPLFLSILNPWHSTWGQKETETIINLVLISWYLEGHADTVQGPSTLAERRHPGRPVPLMPAAFLKLSHFSTDLAQPASHGFGQKPPGTHNRSRLARGWCEGGMGRDLDCLGPASQWARGLRSGRRADQSEPAGVIFGSTRLFSLMRAAWGPPPPERLDAFFSFLFFFSFFFLTPLFSFFLFFSLLLSCVHFRVRCRSGCSRPKDV